MKFTFGLMTTCAVGTLATAALADPPERVGRVSYVEGEVSFQPPREDFWTSATRNFPVATGEAFWTGDAGRAELQVGAVAARLDSETELDVVDVDYGTTRLSLAQGSLDLRLWRAPRGGVSVATPAGDIRLDYAGSYRIDVGAPQEDGSYPPVEVTVFEGSAQAPSPDGPIQVDAGEAAMIYAGYPPQAVDAQDAAIDDWARDREQRERWDAYSDQSPGMTGVEDLESYGQFEDTPDYGQVWFPRDVDPDWAPYKFGHWAFVNPWGWTWIDDQPWGFAPFHYGRWAQVDGRWGWIAGRRVAEPVYAPALVAFIGGGGWSAGQEAGGAMGWVALGPDEAYRPDYRVSETYARQLNAASVNPTMTDNDNAGGRRRDSVDQFRNGRAAVVVSADAFARGAPVQRAVVPLSAQAMATAPVASPASRPAPTMEARSGIGARMTSGAVGPRAGSISAPPPPRNLEAVRRAVIARPAGAFSPPAIPGASVAPPRQGPTPFVAPSQLRHPDAQARQPAPIARPTVPLAPAPGMTTPRATPLRALPRTPPAEGYASPPASPPRRFERPQPGPPAGSPVEPSTQPGPGPGPRPDAGAEMRARAAEAQARRSAAQQEQQRLQREQGAQQAAQARAAAQERARMQQEQLRLQQGPAAPQQRNPRTQPLRAQPDQRQPQTEAQPSEPVRNRPAAPARPRYRIGPDGKPVPIPADESPRP
jgi:hypothetical protein